MLSCKCDTDDFEWYYNHPVDMEPIPLATKRARRSSNRSPDVGCRP